MDATGAIAGAVLANVMFEVQAGVATAERVPTGSLAVVTQTLVELVGMVVLVRIVPTSRRISPGCGEREYSGPSNASLYRLECREFHRMQERGC